MMCIERGAQFVDMLSREFALCLICGLGSACFVSPVSLAPFPAARHCSCACGVHSQLHVQVHNLI